MSTQRATRPTGRDRTTGSTMPSKSHHHNNSNNAGSADSTSNMKNQPTAEQVRVAQMYSDGVKHAEDPELFEKITQAMELTGRTTDDALVALHDCDNDLNRAVERLLENVNEGEWKEAGKKRRSQVSSKPPASSNNSSSNPSSISPNHSTMKTDHHRGGGGGNEDQHGGRSNDRLTDRSGSSARGRRSDNRAPPRFRGRGRENDENERNRSESGGRGGFERGRGRGRGMRGMTRGGRGRGRGGFSAPSSSSWSAGGTGSDAGGFGMPNSGAEDDEHKGFGGQQQPQIDTWTNETADSGDKENMGAWGDVADDWSTEDWTGSLDESKVFTQSTNKAVTDTNGGATTGGGGFDSLNASEPIESSIYTSDGSTAHRQGAFTRQPAVGTPPTVNNSEQQNSIGQRVDLSEMFAKPAADIPNSSSALNASTNRSSSEFLSKFGSVMTTEMNGPSPPSVPAASEPAFMSQYAREATESIKNAVGIGSGASPRTATASILSETPPPMHHHQPLQQPSHPNHHHHSPPHPLGHGGVGAGHRVASTTGGGCSRQRTKLPPPSKIPASAVVMPGEINFDLDVQFGNWDVTPSSSDPAVAILSFGDVTQPVPVTIGLGTGGPGPNSYTNSINSTSPVPASLSNSRLGPAAATTPDASSAPTPSATDVTSCLTTSAAPTTSQTTSGSAGGGGGGMFPSAPTATTPPKEYPKMSPSPLEQQMSSFSTSQTDRKSTNNYASQRTNQPTGSLNSMKPASQSQLSYSGTSAYNSAPYQSSTSSSSSSSAYKSTPLNYGVSSAATSQPQYSYTISQPTHQQAAALYATHYHDSNAYQDAPSGAYANHSAAAAKLSDSLNKMAIADDHVVSSPPQTNGGFDASSVPPSPGMSSVSATMTTASNSMGCSSGGGVGGMSASNSHGIATSMSSAMKSASSKAPPNLPPGVPPVLGANYMMGQPGAMPFPFNIAPLQTPMYTYEDLQMLQQRLTMPGYYDLPYQPPTTLPTALRGDPTSGFPPGPYAADGKLGRVDAQSPVLATVQQRGGPAGTAPNAGPGQSGHQQQQFMNPAATIPPGYNHYYYPAGGLLHGGYPYQPALYQMPSVTNAHAGGGSTATSQFQKPAQTYGAHAYAPTGAQSADFGKPYGSVAGLGQSQPKGSVSLPSSTSDLNGSGYSKAHTQTFDKGGFHGATTPPFGLASGAAGGAGTQGGPLGAGAGPLGGAAGYGAPYGVQMMTHQPHSQMLHHHLQQDSVGNHGGAGSQAQAAQQKPGVTKGYGNPYWGSN